MAMEPLIDSLESVAEPLREHYSEVKDGDHKGKFMLSVSSKAGFALEDVSGLKSSLSKERARAEKAEKSLKRWGDLDADEVPGKLAQLEKLLKDDGGEGGGDVAKKVEAALANQKAELEKKFGKDREQWTGREKFLASEVERLLVDASAAAACAKHGADFELIGPHVRSQVRVKEIEDPGSPFGKRFVARVRGDGDSDKMSDAQGSTDPMEIEELVGGPLKERFGAAFNGHGRSGSGAGGSGDAGGGGGNGSPLILSQEDARDPVKYRAARATAEKEGREVKIAAE